jgi:hypothetical protein
MLGSSRVAAQLAASQEGLSSMSEYINICRRRVVRLSRVLFAIACAIQLVALGLQIFPPPGKLSEPEQLRNHTALRIAVNNLPSDYLHVPRVHQLLVCSFLPDDHLLTLSGTIRHREES